MLRKVQSDQVPAPATPYSQAILAEGARTLYVSGQVPVDASGQLVGEGDIRAQVHQVFRNVQANLEAAGATWRNVAKLTVFLTDITHFPIFSEVRQEYLQPDYPAASTVAISALVRPEWLVEIEAVAVLD